MKLRVNGEEHAIAAATPDTPLLWILRDQLELTGTKFGCGTGHCGACTVHLDGVAVRSCITPLSSVGARSVTTIEGLGGDHPVQRAWSAASAPQCGYCQPGFIMAVSALHAREPRPTAAEAEAAIGNLCRCGTYPAIRRALAALFDPAEE